jgi:hypothetical protein
MHSTVDKIQAVITGTAQRGLGVRLFSVSIDQTHIAAWKQDLDRCLQMFNASILLKLLAAHLVDSYWFNLSRLS